MERLDNIYESVLSESNFKVGDTIYHPKYGKGVLTFVPGDKSYLRDTAKADFGDNKGQPVKIKDLKKESLSEAFKFTSPYDIQKFLKSNKNFAKEWSVEDMAAFTKQDVKDIKRLAQNAYAQNLVNFNNGKYSDLKESLSEDFKMGDIVSFIDPDWKKTYGNSKYEVGIVTSSGKIKLQDIKTKQRLPYTFEPTSLKKESISSESIKENLNFLGHEFDWGKDKCKHCNMELKYAWEKKIPCKKKSISSESISESINTDLYNKFKKIDSNIIQSLRELREFVAKYYPRLVGNVRNVVDEYSDAVYDIEYNLSHSKESLSLLDKLHESVFKEGMDERQAQLIFNAASDEQRKDFLNSINVTSGPKWLGLTKDDRLKVILAIKKDSTMLESVSTIDNLYESVLKEGWKKRPDMGDNVWVNTSNDPRLLQVSVIKHPKKNEYGVSVWIREKGKGRDSQTYLMNVNSSSSLWTGFSKDDALKLAQDYMNKNKESISGESLKETNQTRNATKVMEVSNKILDEHNSRSGKDLVKYKKEFLDTIKLMGLKLTKEDAIALEDNNYHTELDLLYNAGMIPKWWGKEFLSKLDNLYESVLKEGKKENVIDFIKKQINFDITPYIDEEYSKRNYLIIDLKKIPKNIQTKLFELQNSYGKKQFTLHDAGGLGYALYFESLSSESLKEGKLTIKSMGKEFPVKDINGKELNIGDNVFFVKGFGSRGEKGKIIQAAKFGEFIVDFNGNKKQLSGKDVEKEYLSSESVLKEGNGFLDYKGDWRGDNVKYLENDYKLWDNPQKYLPELKDFVKRIDYAISQNKDSPLIMASFEKSKKEADNLIKYFEDIIPITKQITKGKSVEDVKSILNKSKYWNWSDRDLMNNNAKVRGPMDLYIDFENDKVVKYNF